VDSWPEKNTHTHTHAHNIKNTQFKKSYTHTSRLTHTLPDLGTCVCVCF